MASRFSCEEKFGRHKYPELEKKRQPLNRKALLAEAGLCLRIKKRMMQAAENAKRLESAFNEQQHRKKPKPVLPPSLVSTEFNEDDS